MLRKYGAFLRPLLMSIWLETLTYVESLEDNNIMLPNHAYLCQDALDAMAFTPFTIPHV